MKESQLYPHGSAANESSVLILPAEVYKHGVEHDYSELDSCFGCTIISAAAPRPQSNISYSDHFRVVLSAVQSVAHEHAEGGFESVFVTGAWGCDSGGFQHEEAIRTQTLLLDEVQYALAGAGVSEVVFALPGSSPEVIAARSVAEDFSKRVDVCEQQYGRRESEMLARLDSMSGTFYTAAQHSTAPDNATRFDVATPSATPESLVAMSVAYRGRMYHAVPAERGYHVVTNSNEEAPATAMEIEDLRFLLSGEDEAVAKETARCGGIFRSAIPAVTDTAAEKQKADAIVEAAWAAYKADMERMAESFNPALEELQSSKAASIIEDELKRDEGKCFQALMYDDATFCGNTSMEIGFKHLKNCRAAAAMQAEFSTEKTDLGRRRKVLIGRTLCGGTTSVVRERVEFFVNSTTVPFHQGELKSRLCVLVWCDNDGICGHYSTFIKHVLTKWTTCPEDRYPDIVSDSLAILACRLLKASAAITPLYTADEEGIHAGTSLFVILIDSN
ncbi:unnamed protein product, partial [Amoebophrya sp. A25]